jgi:hypothetical protein
MFDLLEFPIDRHAFFPYPGAYLHQPDPLPTTMGRPIHRYNGPAQILGPGNLQFGYMGVHFPEEVIGKANGNGIHVCTSFCIL